MQRSFTQELRKLHDNARNLLKSQFDPSLSDMVAAIRRATLDSESLEAQGLRVGLVGNCNSGKSSLINALLGREVAPTGPFELTAWVAVYLGGIRDNCMLVYNDGHIDELQISDFLARHHEFVRGECITRELSRVQITLAHHANGLVLVDLPGMGASRRNENLMRDALTDIDLILWLVDVESIGEIRAVELVRYLRSHGTPIMCIVTKVDLLDSPSDEFREIVEEIAASTGIDAKHILGVTTKTASLSQPHDSYSVANIRAQLDAQLPFACEVRRTAAAALFHRMREALVEWLKEALAHAELQLEEATNDAERLFKAKQYVALALEDHVHQVVRNSLISERSDITRILVDKLSREGQRAEIETTLRVYLQRENLERVMTAVTRGIPSTEAELWRRFMVTDDEPLPPELLRALNQQHTHVELSSIEAAHRRGTDVGDTAFSAAMASSGITAAVGTLVVAIGPAVTLGAAVALVGLPILGVGAVAGMAIRSIVKTDVASSNLLAESAINEVCRVAAEHLLNAGLRVALVELCDRRAEWLLDRRLDGRTLFDLETRVVELRDAIRQIGFEPPRNTRGDYQVPRVSRRLPTLPVP